MSSSAISLDARMAQTSSVDAGPSILPCEAQGLVYDARNERIIDGVDLTLESPLITMIMGPNGAGKSILVRLLHGILKPTSGTIRWGHQPIDEAARLRQAMVFQTPVLLRRSVLANMAFAQSLRGPADKAQCMDALEMVGLSDHANRPARRLSGGERQRLAIARALVSAPHVLFLDEPTASLDPASVVAIEEIVSALRLRGMKIIFITHDIAQARRIGEEVVFVHRGRVLEHSPAEAFFDKPQSQEAQAYLDGRLIV